MKMIEVRNANVNGTPTAYFEVGSGRPLLLLHGFGPGGSASGNWSGIAAELASDHRVLAPDLLGFGQTIVKPGALGFSATVDHIRDFMEHFGIGQADIVGNNYGGALAIKLAVQSPALVRRLILLSPPALSFEVGEGLRKLWSYLPSEENMHALMTSFVHDPQLITRGAARARHYESVAPGILDAFRTLFGEPHGARLEELASDEAVLSELTHPCMLLHGREDAIVPVAVSLRLSRLLGNADLHIFANCGNLIHVERRHDFLALVREFLSRA